MLARIVSHRAVCCPDGHGSIARLLAAVMVPVLCAVRAICNSLFNFHVIVERVPCLYRWSWHPVVGNIGALACCIAGFCVK